MKKNTKLPIVDPWYVKLSRETKNLIIIFITNSCLAYKANFPSGIFCTSQGFLLRIKWPDRTYSIIFSMPSTGNDIVYYLTGELTLLSTYYVTGILLKPHMTLNHWALKLVPQLSSYLYHTYADSDNADIQEVGLEPYRCFLIATLEQIICTNDTPMSSTLSRGLLGKAVCIKLQGSCWLVGVLLFLQTPTKFQRFPNNCKSG